MASGSGSRSGSGLGKKEVDLCAIIFEVGVDNYISTEDIAK